MSDVKITIDGRELVASAGETVLSVARRNGIEIPTLCFDESLNPYGACGLCVVAMEGTSRLFRACATAVAEGQVIYTNTEAVRRARKTALELLLSNHKGDCEAPCKQACPAGSDCQGYIGLIANNRFEEAAQLIKETYPLGASIGRVCPHPCEKVCRRGKVEHPINIARLKQFAADMDLNSGKPYLPKKAPETGKKVAIIGGGPAGLTMAYFLALKGHKAVIFEMMPQAGGMLRYGIPEYRLPKNVLDLEIAQIERLGVEIRTNTKLGKDVQFADLRREYDAVYLANGAWQSSSMRCEGEDLAGVVGGIDLLGNVALGHVSRLSGKVAVVGGGNTAMDACRTAVRLGAEKVYVLYRRTEAEMPAEDTEIREAKEEGVEFKFLVAPTRILGEDGHVDGIELQQMKLGEPDESGRRKPVPIEGGIEVLPVDVVIAAIGQKVVPLDLGADTDKLEYTAWKTIAADNNTYATSIPGVFAGGDAINDGPGIAIQAIAHGKEAAQVVDSYLSGEMKGIEKPYYCLNGEPEPEFFKQKSRVARVSISYLHPEYRKSNFMEVAKCYDPSEAMFEASRCLECGCGDKFECRLLHFAQEYNVEPEKYAGEICTHPIDKSHPFIVREPNKCILCGNCVRVCSEVIGEDVLGLSGRGFTTTVQADFGLPLDNSSCISCGQCVAVCPTGALQERQPWQKPVPLDSEAVPGVCSFCGNACALQVNHMGDYVNKVTPGDGGMLCQAGRFAYPHAMTTTGNPTPGVDYGQGMTQVAPGDALRAAAAGINSIREAAGTDTIGVAIGDQLTVEEIFLAKYLAEEVIGTEYVYAANAEIGGVADVFGFDASTATVEDMEAADVVLAVGCDIAAAYPLLGVRLKKAVKAGQKLLLLSDNPGALAKIAYKTYPTGGNIKLLAELAGGKNDSEAAAEIAELLKKAKKPLILLDRSRVTAAAAKAAAILAAGGEQTIPLLQLRANVNSQAVRDLGISRDLHTMQADIEQGKLKAVLLLGVDLPADYAEKVEFVMIADANYGRAYPYSAVLMPLSGFGAITGSYVNFEGRLQKVEAAVKPYQGQENWQWLAEFMTDVNSHYKFTDLTELRQFIAYNYPDYAPALLEDKPFIGGEKRQTPAVKVAEVPAVESAFYREFENESTSLKSWQRMKH
jgi:formate dehydrogenase major subunit